MAFLTVMVPVRNEAAGIETLLRALLTQRTAPHRFEVIVADGRSTDDTVPIVRSLQGEFPNLRLVDNPSRLSSAGRNLCVRHGRGDLFVLVDGHCDVPGDDYLRNVIELFAAHPGAGCLGRPQPLEGGTPTRFQRAVALARQSRLGHNPDSQIYSSDEGYVPPQNVAVAYRRAVFATVGLFDETFDACEDVEFNHRVAGAGIRCYFSPKIRLDYHPRGSLGGLVYQMTRYGRGRGRLARKHASAITLPSLVPAAFLLWLAVTFALGLVSPIFAAGFCGTLLVYAAVLAGLTASVLMRSREPAGCWVPAVVMGIHVGFGWGTIREWVGASAKWLRSRRVEQGDVLSMADIRPVGLRRAG
jgi:GT2 family glycosyltransferase